MTTRETRAVLAVATERNPPLDLCLRTLERQLLDFAGFWLSPALRWISRICEP